ncbi:MAG: TIR domain-containing protein [Nitrospirae bacterium]|nr:TIR domain-containing protein [Nitrospirota bacterium]
MNKEIPTNFDVFLCHNDKDESLIESIATTLKENSINPFFDRWYLLPGQSWLKGIETGFKNSSSMAVFLGPHGIGNIQDKELEMAIIRQAKEKEFPVIPVLLPGASRSGLSCFLSPNGWVDFRQGIDNPEELKRLIAGIKKDLQILSGTIQENFSTFLNIPKATRPTIVNVSFEDIKKALFKASNSLLNWPSTLSDGRWLERDELNQIKEKIESESTSITLLLGPPGSGKSALLARLAHEFIADNMALMAIKADLLPADIGTSEQLMKTLHLPAAPLYCIEVLSKLEPIVLIVDQLDALADMVDLHSGRTSTRSSP